MVNAMNWSCVEVAVAIFIACIPSFNTLIIYRFPRLQKLLGLPSNKGDATCSSKTYGSSSRRAYNSITLEPRNSLKMNQILGQNQADVESRPTQSQECILHAGIQVTTNVRVNNKNV